MISFELFEKIVREITESLPEPFFRELSGGVMVQEEEKLHPASLNHDLFVMGEYQCRPYLGRFVVLYYGSFVRCCGGLDETAVRERIRKVILHEFRHHLESLAGERDLEIEDARELAEYTAARSPSRSKQ